MLDPAPAFDALPNAPGVGYKPQHFSDLRRDPGPVSWIEVHAENYMGDGGRPLAQLEILSEQFALSVHGVGLSIGGEEPLDPAHLARLKHLNNWAQPTMFSEHLAWSTHEGAYLNDLLPLPYTEKTLQQVAGHISQLQNLLGRQMLLENPSSYLAFEDSTFSETDFLGELVHKTSCGLLLDVNNVFVSSTNLKFKPQDYINAFPLDAVGEIHIGGHDADCDGTGAPLLIDSHGVAVADPVWSLLDHTVRRSGPKPILVEWDNNVPDWLILRNEAEKAAAVLSCCERPA